MSRGRPPRGRYPPPEGVDVAYPLEQQRAAKVHRLGLLNAQSPGKGVEGFARAFEWRRAAMPSHSVLLPASPRQRAPSPNRRS
jgi:hypothetical protein